MSRHRNVRSMNYTDEYDGYDDVYGHSVEDDYCVSPSQAAFMYDREGPKAKPKIGAFFERDNDIAEENEDVETKESNLSEIDRTRLEACIEQIKQSLNITSSKQYLIDAILLCNFNAEKCLKLLLDRPEYKDNKQEKDVKFSLQTTKKGFTIPKFNTKIDTSATVTYEAENYTSLADLTSHHLNKVGFKVPTVFENKLDKVVQVVSSISLDDNKPTPVKSLNALKDDNILNPDWHIDLTKALRITNSAPQVRLQLVQEEPFVPQFVDCERDSSIQKTNNSLCSMDISWILKAKQRNLKKPSKFAKIICARYKTIKPIYFDNNIWPINIRPFMFDVPSPDDFIRQHLARN